ncbi:MAG: YceI family protein [Leptospira sp.]|nr:YceI family protein [Leptospira sp.]
MKKRFSIVSGFLVLLAFTGVNAGQFEVDPGHSSVNFQVRHLVTNVNGLFTDFNGSFTFDEKKPETSKVSFKVKVTSINTNEKKRDDHLRSEEFFDIKKFPEMSFESTKIASAGKNKYKLEGNLTIKGVTKKVVFDTEYTGTGKDPWGNVKSGFSASSVINRKDFGINWNKTLDNGGYLVGDEVKITVNVEAATKQ